MNFVAQPAIGCDIRCARRLRLRRPQRGRDAWRAGPCPVQASTMSASGAFFFTEAMPFLAAAALL